MGMTIWRVGELPQEVIDHWTLVALPMVRKTMRHDTVEIRNQWLRDADSECGCCPDWKASIARFYFENPDVAFAFKMRFG